MFLVHGFDNVTVARIAAACEVSEQTVFNYFPTKESMFFDRSESDDHRGGGCRPGTWDRRPSSTPSCTR